MIKFILFIVDLFKSGVQDKELLDNIKKLEKKSNNHIKK
jgi:hypothetical protein